ncbi:MAG: hypothetical protein PUC77_01335 [Bacteroidales bacterium]|nr:hypothetical protein [Bacteroidales bacterium]
MNHKFAALLLSMLPLCANGALSTSGSWGDYDVSGTEEVTLTGDVAMWNVVRIPKGSKLIIHGNGHKINIRNFNFTVTEDNAGTNSCYSFDVRGELEIYGPITLDGGNTKDFGYVGGGGEPETFRTKMNGNYYNGRDAGETNSANAIIVHNCGAKLTIEDATFQNVTSHLYIPPVVAFTDDYANINGTWQYSDGAHTRADITAGFTNVNFNNCLDDTGQGIIKFHNQLRGKVTFDNCKFSSCAVYDYGGVVKGFGGGNTNNIQVTMNGCTFHHCLSYGWGGAILWAMAPTNNISKLMLNNCTFYENYARGLGGAVSNEGTVELTRCTIRNNYAGLGGGGIASFPFSLAESSMGNANGLVLNAGNIITNNTSKQTTATGSPFGTSYPSGGGGIWILMNKENWTCNAVIGEGNEISGNESAFAGGGILLHKSNGSTTSLTSAAIIHNNTSTHAGGGGGGIAIGTEGVSELPSVTINGGEIYENESTDYHGGGVYMPGGKFTMSAGTIRDNSAALNGGGFYIKNGSVEITSANAQITGNYCRKYGAGLYVGNTGDSYINTTFSGGTINGNGARGCVAGGGICVEGKVNFTTTNTNIENNEASFLYGNGGGICVLGGAKMTYESGLIRNNKAGSKTTTSYNTGYKKGVEDIGGFGGGVFVAGDGSSLTFNMGTGKSLGLYGNVAINGGDDVFANGDGTTVTIPDVSEMTLSEFKVPVPENSLFWAEDYATDDPNYGYGTKINTDWTSTNGTNVRYRYALDNMIEPYKVPAQTLTKYTSLALGYGVVYVTIEKEGLKEGENAIFEITKGGATEPYMRLLISGKTDSDGKKKASQKVALFPGTWNVKETNWSWTYSSDQPVNGITREIDNDSPDEVKTFKFVNTKKSDVKPHSESIVKNTF